MSQKDKTPAESCASLKIYFKKNRQQVRNLLPALPAVALAKAGTTTPAFAKATAGKPAAV
jgi:hypothetical protein